MAESSSKLVVRAYSPRRRALLFGGAALLGIFALYGMFELGRYDAGYRVLDTVRGGFATSERIRELDAENARLRAQLEAIEIARRVDKEGYRQVERSLGEMQSQIARLNQDLSFYRGLVQPDSAVGVKVQRMQILQDSVPGAYHLKFVLMQTGKSDKPVTGNAEINLQGMRQGKPAILSLARISPKRRPTLAYSFRYFQDFDELLQLPGGFEPTRIDLEIRAGRDPKHGFRQAFAWRTQGESVEMEANDRADVSSESD